MTLEKGIGMAGVDVGESYGSPRGCAIYIAFWETLRTRYHMAKITAGTSSFVTFR